MNGLTLGKKIKKARLDLRLTQQDVAGNFITRNMLSKIESDVATPSIKTIKYLAERLNKPISYFLNNEYDKTQSIDKDSKVCFEHASFLVKNIEYDKCISYINQTLKTIDEEASGVYYGRLLYLLAKCNIKLNNYDLVNQYLGKAIEILEPYRDYYFLADTYFYKSNVAFHSKRFKESESYVRKATTALDKSYVSDVLLETKLYFSLAYSLFEQDNYKESIEILNHVLDISKKYKCFYNYGDTYMLLGILYRKMNDLNQAIDYTKKAILFYDSLGELDSKASCEKNIGNYYLIINDFDNASKYLNESLKYFDEIKDIRKVNTIKSDIQELLVKKGDYTKAIEYVDEIDIDKIKTVDQARIYMNLGKSYTGINDYIKAEDSLRKSEDLLKDSNRFDILQIIYDSYSHMYSLLKDFEKAYIYSEKSKKYLELSLKK